MFQSSFRRTIGTLSFFFALTPVVAQSVSYIATTAPRERVETRVRWQVAHTDTATLVIPSSPVGRPFKAWATTFNELDYDALSLLPTDRQEELLRSLFAPDGELRFTRGRIPMNANDYARSWYSCDEVPGDLELRYFNIDRDKQAIIPLVHAAQRYNPNLTFWLSPWSPPSWMKINHDYPVVSSKWNTQDKRKDYLLYGTVAGIDENEMKAPGHDRSHFPRRLATQDFFINDARYLAAYAEYFCRFIDAYRAEGIDIDMVTYQNEAYSYTPYPGCPWTAEGTIRFNRDYLAPRLKQRHPDVKLFLGTINTNRADLVHHILADSLLRARIDGVALQWEGRELLPGLRAAYPNLRYICSESECGNGSMDWRAAEHTFMLIADNLGNGADEWTNWNFILPKGGVSRWGWRQNALISVDTLQRTATLTPEWEAVRHFSHYVTPGSRLLAYHPQDANGIIAIAFQRPDGATVVVAANRADVARPLSVLRRTRGKARSIALSLPPHSLHTFISKK